MPDVFVETIGETVSYPDDWSDQQISEHALATFKPPQGAIERVARNIAGSIVESAAAIPETVAIIAGKLSSEFPALGETRPQSELPTQKAADWMRYQAQKLYPDPITRPEGVQGFLTETLPQGAGSMAAILAGGAGARMLKIPAMVSTAALGAATTGANAFREAVAAGSDNETAFRAFFIGAGIGTTEAVPIAKWLSGNPAADKLKTALIDGSEELVQSVFSEVAGNVSAQNLYDPERPWLQGAGEAGAAGFTLGTLFSLAVSAAGGKKIAVKVAQERAREAGAPLTADILDIIPETPKVIQDQIQAEAKTVVEQPKPVEPTPAVETFTPQEAAVVEVQDQAKAAAPEVQVPIIDVKTGLTFEGNPITSKTRAEVRRAADVINEVNAQLGPVIEKIVIQDLDETSAGIASAPRAGSFDTVVIDPVRLADSISNGLDLKEAVHQEVIHNLDGLAVQKEWEAQGKQGNFRSFWDQHHKAIADEMTPEEKAQTEKIYGAKIKSDVHMAAEFVQLLLRGEFRGIDAKPNNALTRLLTWIKDFWGGFTGNDTNAEVSRAAKDHVSKIEAILNSRNLPRPSGKSAAVAVGASLPPDAAGVQSVGVEQPAGPGAGAPGAGGVEGPPPDADGVGGSLGAGLPGEWAIAGWEQVHKTVGNLQGVTDTEKDLITTRTLDEVFKRAAEYYAENGNMEGFATARVAQQQAINGLKAERAKKRAPEGGSVSLDAPVAAGADQTISETVAAESKADTAATDAHDAAKRLMEQLPDASRKLLEMVETGERGWMAKMAKEEGVSKAAISSRLETARKQLARLMMTDPAAREAVADMGYDPDDLINAAPVHVRNEDVNEKDARDAIRALIARGAFDGAPQRVAIAEKLVSMDKGGITVRVVSQDTANQLFKDRNVAGFWSGGARTEKGIYLVEGRWNTRPGRAVRSIMHEYIHGLTHEFIKANPESDKVIRLIDLGREAYIKRMQKGDKAYDGYAFNFVHEQNQAIFASEFLAEAMASANLQKFLGSIRAPKWAAESRIETVWDAFVDAVRSILGLKKGTALSEILSTGLSIVESAQKTTESKSENLSTPSDSSSWPFVRFTAEEVINAAPPIQTADMMGPARKARDLSPSQKLIRFMRPSTWGIPGYLRDVAERTQDSQAVSLLGDLADAVEGFYDYKASLIGAVQSHFFKTTGGLDAATLDKVKNEVELWASTAQARDNQQTMQAAWMNAEKIIPTLSKEAQQIIADIKRHGQASGVLMKRLDVHVQAADGGWRPLINLGEMWWPRRINDRVNEILGDPDHYKQEGSYWKLVGELMAHDPINFDTQEKADAYLTNRIVGTMGNGDFFAGAEMARGEKLPDAWYDYTLDGYMLHMESWANRVAQIAAFGQSRPGRLDLFDQVDKFASRQSKTFGSEQDSLKKRIAIFKDEVTDSHQLLWNDKLGKIITSIAAARYLTATLTMVRNVSQSTAAIGENLGWANAFKATTNGLYDAARAIGASAKAGRLIEPAMVTQAAAAGAVQRSLYFSRIFGVDVAGDTKTGKVFRALMQPNQMAEMLTRSISHQAAMLWLKDAADEFNANPMSKASLRMQAQMQRWGLNKAQRLAAMNGDAVQANRLFRAATKEKLYGYRPDQVPLIFRSRYGKLLLQFQSWGAQRSRDIAKNLIGPMWHGEVVDGVKIRNPWPALRFIVGVMAGTALVNGIKEAIFDRRERGTEWEEIVNAMSEDEQIAAKLAVDRIMHDLTATGAAGILPDYLRILKDSVTPGRQKSFVNAPGLQLAADITALLKDQIEREVDPASMLRDVRDRLLRTTPLVKEIEDVSLGLLLSNTEAAQVRAARQDVSVARAKLRAWAKETGRDDQAKRRGAQASKTPNSETYDQLQEALLIGDVQEAGKIVNEFTNYRSDRTKLNALKSSMRSRHPIQVSGYDKADVSEFMTWLKRRNPAEFDRASALVQRFEKTKALVGL